jgi:hypothetical protein
MTEVGWGDAVVLADRAGRLAMVVRLPRRRDAGFPRAS